MHGHSEHPRPGDVVNVLFDPKSHNVKLAPEYTTSPRQVEHERAHCFKTIADARPGTDSSPHPSREIGAARIVQPPASPARSSSEIWRSAPGDCAPLIHKF
jgi:hypothetical protein